MKATDAGFVPPPTPGAPGPFTAPGAFPPSADSATFSFDFTYTVNADGSFTSETVPGTFHGTFLQGPRAVPVVQTFTIADFPPFVGLISSDAKTLTLAHVAAAVETISFSNGDVWPRICHRSRTAIKLRGGDHDGGDDGDHGH